MAYLVGKGEKYYVIEETWGSLMAEHGDLESLAKGRAADRI